MNDATGWFSAFGRSAEEMLDQIVAYLPNLLAALVLLVIGWAVGSLLKWLVQKIGFGVNRLLDRYLTYRGFSKFRLAGTGLRLVGQAVFWLVILFFVTAAARVAQLDTFSGWLDRLIAYLPTLLAGALIVFVGYLISIFMRDVVSATTSRAGVSQSHFIGAVAQGITLLAAAIIGADQIGLDVSFLTTITAIILGAGLLALAVAFGLGASGLVSNLIGAHYAQAYLKPGQTARIGEHEGQVLEMTAISVVLETAHGRTSIPARLFTEQTTTVLTPGATNE